MNDQPEPMWTIEDVSHYLRIPVETLYQWRRKKQGPPACKMGKHLRYDPAGVREWFTANAA
ncbi:helix-turn-helix domain-containing protein [Pseudonocardia alni]|uniref:helix-turn-helix domain-containing protein n=1 Tax=Pseudonocardia alni TaxID=33907 RepID=UPI0036A7C374